MKAWILFVAMTLSLNSCAMGRRSLPAQERKEQDKMYHPCTDEEVGNPLGKFCNRFCQKRSRRGICQSWKITVKDSMKVEDFNFFRNNSMVLISEDYLK